MGVNQPYKLHTLYLLQNNLTNIAFSYTNICFNLLYKINTIQIQSALCSGHIEIIKHYYDYEYQLHYQQNI